MQPPTPRAECTLGILSPARKYKIYTREREAIYFAGANIGFGDKLAASEKFPLKARKLDGLLTFSIAW